MKQRIEIEIYIHTKLWMRIWTTCKKIVNFSSIERTSERIDKKGGKKKEHNITKENNKSKSNK